MTLPKIVQSDMGAELVESPTLRSRHLGRTDVLDKVKGLATLPGNQHATVKQVAEFYDVPAKTISSVVVDNRAELESNGYTTLTGAQLNSLKEFSCVGRRARSLAVFTRTAVLNVGMLLTESETARQVRAYLLAVEATATVEHRNTAVGLLRLQERQDYQNILRALRMGGAVSGDDYRHVQNSLYLGLFGKTATQIRETQPQRTGEESKRSQGALLRSKVAKDYLTVNQLRLLDAAVLACTAQLQAKYPGGATVAQMVDAVGRAVSIVQPQQIGA